MSDVLTVHQRRIYVQIRAQAEAEFGLAPDAPLFVCFKEEFFPALFPTIPPSDVSPARYSPPEQWRLWAHRLSSVCGLLRWQGRAHTRYTYWRFCLEDERQRAKFLAHRFLVRYPRVCHGLRLLSALLGAGNDPGPRL